MMECESMHLEQHLSESNGHNCRTIDRAPDGTTKVTHADGLEVETFDDDSKRIKLPDGKYRFVPPPDHSKAQGKTQAEEAS